jgi:S-(hydroxymethyl)glutathione dehydrogenase / alcohol dehydrogenase
MCSEHCTSDRCAVDHAVWRSRRVDVRAGLTLGVDEYAVEDVTSLPPGPRDVVVRIGASGVCHSDLSVLNGAVGLTGPMVLGHEAAGTVEWVGGEVTRLAVGDRVVASLMPVCGSCWHCRRFETHLCEEAASVLFEPRVARDSGELLSCLSGLGTFAEVMTVSEWSLVPVHTELPDEQLALLGCGVTTGLGSVLNTARPPTGATIAVIGCGGVGMAAVQGAVLAGASMIVAVDPVAAKREAALLSGATHVVDPGAAPIAEQVRSHTGGGGVDVVIEAAGRGPLLEEAMGSTRRGGTTVVVGAPSLDTSISINPMSLMVDDRTIQGSFYGDTRAHRDIPLYVELAEAGRLDLAGLVSRRIGIDEVGNALRDLGGNAIRSVMVNG